MNDYSLLFNSILHALAWVITLSTQIPYYKLVKCLVSKVSTLIKATHYAGNYTNNSITRFLSVWSEMLQILWNLITTTVNLN